LIESIRSREGRQVGNAVFCQISLNTCYDFLRVRRATVCFPYSNALMAKWRSQTVSQKRDGQKNKKKLTKRRTFSPLGGLRTSSHSHTKRDTVMDDVRAILAPLKRVSIRRMVSPLRGA